MPSSSSVPLPVRWPASAYAAIVLVACVFAFVGLDRSNYWADELFTVFVIGGDDGLAGVWRRALTDVHPPLYYMLLHGWSRLGGVSEAWLRLPSAVCAVLALLLTARVLWRRFTPAALGYALAMAASSFFFFEQSQNARSYGVSILVAAGLLGLALRLRERTRATGPFPAGAFAALFALGLAGSFIHFYLLLLTGMVLAWLLAVPRLRVPVIAAGLLILAAVGAYTWLLLQATAQDVDRTWYRADLRFFWDQTGIARKHLATAASGWMLTLLCAAALRQRWRGGRGSLAAHVPDAGRVAAQLSLLVLVGMIASGVLVSCLLAPSYSARNVLIALPFICALLAWLYDAAGPKLGSGASHALAALLVLAVASNLWLIRGRLIERNEPWRATAQFVARMPGCAGQPVPVMHPYKFGPPTSAFRAFAEQQFFGLYAPAGMQIEAWMPSELVGRHPVPALRTLLATRAEQAGQGGCALLAWAVHDLDKKSAPLLAEDLARAPGIAPRRVVMQRFLRGQRRSLSWKPTDDGFVFYVLPPAAAGAAPADPGPLVDMPDGVLGNRDVVTLKTSLQDKSQVDRFAVQTWSADGRLLREAITSAPHLTCDPPMRADDGIRPGPDQPGCAAVAP
jgi:hypothetical protein